MFRKPTLKDGKLTPWPFPRRRIQTKEAMRAVVYSNMQVNTGSKIM